MQVSCYVYDKVENHVDPDTTAIILSYLTNGLECAVNQTFEINADALYIRKHPTMLSFLNAHLSNILMPYPTTDDAEENAITIHAPLGYFCDILKCHVRRVFKILIFQGDSKLFGHPIPMHRPTTNIWNLLRNGKNTKRSHFLNVMDRVSTIRPDEQYVGYFQWGVYGIFICTT